MYQREIVLYTGGRSFQSWRAKRFLKSLGCRFEVVDTAEETELLSGLSSLIRGKVMMPYFFVDDRPLGDLGAVRQLSRLGGLEHLLRDRL